MNIVDVATHAGATALIVVLTGCVAAVLIAVTILLVRGALYVSHSISRADALKDFEAGLESRRKRG